MNTEMKQGPVGGAGGVGAVGGVGVLEVYVQQLKSNSTGCSP